MRRDVEIAGWWAASHAVALEVWAGWPLLESVGVAVVAFAVAFVVARAAAAVDARWSR